MALFVIADTAVILANHNGKMIIFCLHEIRIDFSELFPWNIITKQALELLCVGLFPVNVLPEIAVFCPESHLPVKSSPTDELQIFSPVVLGPRS